MKSPADMKIIQIDITNACPKRCSNCTRFCGHHKKPFFMDFETFKQAVDSMKGFKGIVGIMGGEPTIHPQFEKFVRYFRDHIGYDDYSTACIEPTADFCKHVLANAYHVDYSNHRGLWTSLNPRYYDNFELIQDTFGFQLVNDHTNPSMHQAHMATRQELGIPDKEWVKLRDACWVQNLWSASITPKGAFFCEMAAAMDATLGGPGGWKIEPGWWKRTPADFAGQLHWCELCSAALPMPKRDANQEIDDVSPVWREKLVQIDSPKVKKGLIHEFDPKAYSAGEHQVICEMTPYINDQEQRVGDARKVLQPRRIIHAAWLTDALAGDAGTRVIERLQADARLDIVLSGTAAHRVVADSLSVPFLYTTGRSGADIFRELRERTSAHDWILLMRDGVPSPASFQLLGDCVFNPGCVYIRRPGRSGAGFQFFNVRAEALRHGGDLFDLAPAYPARKVVGLASDRASRYRLTPGRMFYRRAIKRAYWAHKRLGRKFARMPVAAQL
jgi:hypothetical protein